MVNAQTGETAGGSADVTEALGPIGRQWIEAISTRRFQALSNILATDVAFRALVPRGLREAATPDGAIAWIERWFGEADDIRLVETADGTVADREWFAYRLHVHEPDGWRLVEQQVYATVADGRIQKVDLLCSGFRPAEAPADAGEDSGSSAATRRESAAALSTPSATLDALGADCSTLIPTLARSMAGVPVGGVLEIVTDDPTAEPSLAAWTRLTGHELIGSRPDPAAGSHWFLRKKES
jgi:TusA-related sulfurtransferase